MGVFSPLIFLRILAMIFFAQSAMNTSALALNCCKSNDKIEPTAMTQNETSIGKHLGDINLSKGQFGGSAHYNNSPLRFAQNQSNDLSQFGVGSGPWVNQYVMGRIEGTTFYTWNDTNFTFSDVEINVKANNKTFRRQGRVLTGNIDIIIPEVTRSLSSCSFGFNRDTGEWIKVTAEYIAPRDNYMRRLRNMESVEFEVIDYKLLRLPGRPSCN